MTAPMTPEEVSAEDRRIMGSTEAAKLALIDRTKEWRALRQPVMANRAALNEIDAKEREARFQLANAAALWLWHEENPAPGVAQSAWQPIETAPKYIQEYAAMRSRNIPRGDAAKDHPVAGIRLTRSQKKLSSARYVVGMVDRIEAALRNCAPQETRGDEPVAWRWKPKHAASWIYDPDAEWLALQSLDTIDVEPLYAASQQSPRLEREGIEAAVRETLKHLDRTAAAPLSNYTFDTWVKTILALLSPDTTVVSSTSRCEVGK